MMVKSEHRNVKTGEVIVEEYDDGQPEPTQAEIDAALIRQIKAEAYRRIVAILPEWKQRNLTVRAVVLTEKGRVNWTAEELAEWDAGMALWQQVQAIRDASNTLEAMSPIPDDFATNEVYWSGIIQES